MSRTLGLRETPFEVRFVTVGDPLFRVTALAIL